MSVVTRVPKRSRAELKADVKAWRLDSRYWRELAQDRGKLLEADAVRFDDEMTALERDLAEARTDAEYQKAETLRWHGEYMGILDQALRSSVLEKELADARAELEGVVAGKKQLWSSFLRVQDEKRELSEKVAGLVEALTASEDARLLTEKRLTEEVDKKAAGSRMPRPVVPFVGSVPAANQAEVTSNPIKPPWTIPDHVWGGAKDGWSPEDMARFDTCAAHIESMRHGGD